MRPSSILVLGAMLIASTAYATPGVQDERVYQDAEYGIPGAPGSNGVVVAFIAYPKFGEVTEVLGLVRVEYHAGSLALLKLRGIGRLEPVAATSGGLPT